MNGFALFLVIVSTFMHAGWNLITRHRRTQAVAIIYRAHLWVMAVGLVPTVLAELWLEPLPREVWVYALVSGIFCGVHFFGLAHGYRSADLSVVYPVVGAVPVLLVGLGDVARGRFPTTAAWIGMALVATGCLLAPRHSFREFKLRDYLRESSFWMLLAALGTVGYTLVDKSASEALQQGPLSALRYGYLFWSPSFVCYAVLLRVSGTKEAPGEAAGWGFPFWWGLLNFAAYSLILWAYQLAERASYVVAFRQVGIVIGVVAAFALLKERGMRVRLTAALLIVAGLVTIAVWGN